MLFFSAPRRLSRLCLRVARGATRIIVCPTQHENEYRPCATCVVYEIPLTCEKVYIGQTGRYVDDRLCERDCSLNPSDGANLSHHLSAVWFCPAFFPILG